MTNFFALTSRMKYINRWGLMRNLRNENIAEHSLEVAIISHLLCELRNTRFGGNVDSSKAALLAVFHDVPEIITGDLPTPIKYYNPRIREAYKDIEGVANQKLLSMLPDELKEDYTPLVDQPDDCYEHTVVKAADKLSAYIKCVEELRSGNREFAKAEVALKKEVDAYLVLPEVKYFCDTFLDSFSKTLDELE